MLEPQIEVVRLPNKPFKLALLPKYQLTNQGKQIFLMKIDGCQEKDILKNTGISTTNLESELISIRQKAATAFNTRVTSFGQAYYQMLTKGAVRQLTITESDPVFSENENFEIRVGSVNNADLLSTQKKVIMLLVEGHKINELKAIAGVSKQEFRDLIYGNEKFDLSVMGTVERMTGERPNNILKLIKDLFELGFLKQIPVEPQGK